MANKKSHASIRAAKWIILHALFLLPFNKSHSIVVIGFPNKWKHKWFSSQLIFFNHLQQTNDNCLHKKKNHSCPVIECSCWNLVSSTLILEKKKRLVSVDGIVANSLPNGFYCFTTFVCQLLSYRYRSGEWGRIVSICVFENRQKSICAAHE